MKNTIIISAFPGTGKTHFFNENKNRLKVLDSDSSTFDKSDFPRNYIEHIKSNIGKVDVILVSSHEEVRNALKQEEINFVLCYPRPHLKEHYNSRYKKRGNDLLFIGMLYENWDSFILSCVSQEGCIHVRLPIDSYLSDFVQI